MSVASGLAVAWGLLVAVALWPRRPRRALRPAATGPGPRSGPLTRLGRRARTAVGARGDGEGDRQLGALLVLAVVLIPVAPVLAPIALVGAALIPWLAARRRQRFEADAAAEAVPDAVDLFSLALASGLPLPSALPVVAPRVPPPLGPDLVDAEIRSRHGEPLAEALDRVAEARPPARPLVRLLLAAHRDGTPVGEPLARLAEEQRLARRRAAEAEARRVPVRLLFPLVCCTLPAFGLLTVVPPVVVALGDLRT